jgi:DNA-binding HxlR family transcriptional regulator
MNGFIKRTVHTSTSVVVGYELTEYINTLQNVMQALSEWGTMHQETIRKGMQAPMQHKNQLEPRHMCTTGPLKKSG